MKLRAKKITTNPCLVRHTESDGGYLDTFHVEGGEIVEINLLDFSIIDEWKPVVGFENHYEVSNTGKVRTIKRQVKSKHKTRTVNVRVLKHSLVSGYPRVTLSMNNINYGKHVHRLVAEAFIPNPGNKPQVNHKDGNPQNNNVYNLEWCTSKENIAHSYKMGMSKTGEESHKAKLTQKQVDEIKDKYLTGEYSYKDLGEEYGVHPTNIYCIMKGKSWNNDFEVVDECDFCERGVEHIGPGCHNYAGHVKKHKPNLEKCECNFRLGPGQEWHPCKYHREITKTEPIEMPNIFVDYIDFIEKESTYIFRKWMQQVTKAINRLQEEK